MPTKLWILSNDPEKDLFKSSQQTCTATKNMDIGLILLTTRDKHKTREPTSQHRISKQKLWPYWGIAYSTRPSTTSAARLGPNSIISIFSVELQVIGTANREHTIFRTAPNKPVRMITNGEGNSFDDLSHMGQEYTINQRGLPTLRMLLNQNSNRSILTQCF